MVKSACMLYRFQPQAWYAVAQCKQQGVKTTTNTQHSVLKSNTSLRPVIRLNSGMDLQAKWLTLITQLRSFYDHAKLDLGFHFTQTSRTWSLSCLCHVRNLCLPAPTRKDIKNILALNSLNPFRHWHPKNTALVKGKKFSDAEWWKRRRRTWGRNGVWQWFGAMKQKKKKNE